MRYLKETLATLLAAVGLELEPWMAPLAAVAIALLLLPAWRRNFKTKLARKRVQALANAPPPARAALQLEIEDLVRGSPLGQVVVVEEALRRGLRTLAATVLEDLARSGKRPDHVKRLRLELTGERPSTPEEEALAVQRLREAGLEQAAAARLHAARRRWPTHPDLR